MTDQAQGSADPTGRRDALGCRCEATIPSVILDGYACGNPECWRTEPVKASFDAFVADLVRRRDGTPTPGGSD